MQDTLIAWLNQAGSIVWGPPMLVLLVGTGIYLTLILRGLQFRLLWHALHLALVVRREKGDAQGDISHFQALMTALCATVGVGNIAGVATAIAAGGPGALFWMWMTGLFGMATKYAEAVLAVKYRVVGSGGTMSGGPMYYLSRGAGSRWLGGAFALFASVAAFGIGNMVQANSVAAGVQVTFGIPPWVSGLIIAGASALVILGGIRSIARTASFLAPFMILVYSIGALSVIAVFAERIPEALRLVFTHAFTPTSAMGGFAGATLALTIRMGVARGVFSNESGLGSSPIAAAAAKTRDPATQALVSMTQTFIDTLVVCTLTGLAIVTSGAWETGKTGAELTTQAFVSGLPNGAGSLIVALGLILFAYSTILGWCYYGEKSIEYLLGERSVIPYRWLFIMAILVGATVKLDLVWSLADVMNGLMALPNLVGLILLSPVVLDETRQYTRRIEKSSKIS